MVCRSARNVVVTIMALLLLGSCGRAIAVDPAATLSFPTVTLAPGFASPVPGAGDTIPRIAPQEAWERLQAGEAVAFVDTRSVSEYQAAHIVGAISLPAAETAQRWDELPRDSLLVFYCT